MGRGRAEKYIYIFQVNIAPSKKVVLLTLILAGVGVDANGRRYMQQHRKGLGLRSHFDRVLPLQKITSTPRAFSHPHTFFSLPRTASFHLFAQAVHQQYTAVVLLCSTTQNDRNTPITPPCVWVIRYKQREEQPMVPLSLNAQTQAKWSASR